MITDRSSSRKTSKSLFAVAKRNIDNLIDEIYSRFPEHTVNSKRARLVERKVAAPEVYTSGYEGASIDGFLNQLVSSGIRHLVDVSAQPYNTTLRIPSLHA